MAPFMQLRFTSRGEGGLGLGISTPSVGELGPGGREARAWGCGPTAVTCWLAGLLAAWLACWLPGLLACWLAGLLAGLLAGWLAGWLACWLAGWLAGWLAVLLAGWLAC